MKEEQQAERQLADKFLKIPKELRLVGDDGRIHLPAVPDVFYLEEVAAWLSYATKFSERNHANRNCDYTMESIGYRPVRKIDFPINEAKPGRYNHFNNKRLTFLNLFLPLDPLHLEQLELPISDLQRCSYAHHRFLFLALRKVRENHSYFFEILSKKLDITVRTDKQYYQDVLLLLRKVLRQLLDIEEKGHYNFIPMLYSLRDHGVIMSTDLNNVFKYEVEEWGLLYSYGFSTKTSFSVLQVLKSFFSLYIKRYETLVGKSPSEFRDTAPVTTDDRKQVYIPKSTEEKMKLVAEILGLKQDKASDENKLAVEPFQFMLLLRAFKDLNFIRENVDLYKLAIAYAIMYGGSPVYFVRQFEKGDMTAKALKAWSKKSTYKAVQSDVSNLIEKLNEELIPLIQQWEKIAMRN